MNVLSNVFEFQIESGKESFTISFYYLLFQNIVSAGWIRCHMQNINSRHKNMETETSLEKKTTLQFDCNVLHLRQRSGRTTYCLCEKESRRTKEFNSTRINIFNPSQIPKKCWEDLCKTKIAWIWLLHHLFSISKESNSSIYALLPNC